MRELKGTWKDLFNGFMLALDLRKMFLGFVGLILSFGGVLLFLGFCDRYDPKILRNPTVLRPDPTAVYSCRYERILCPKSIEVREEEGGGLTCRGVRMAVADMSRHVLSSPDWQVRVLIPLGVFMILVLIWSYFGGAIARIASVEVAKDERIETQKALQYASRKYGAFFWAPLVCLIGFAFFALCNVAGGAVGGVLEWIGSGLGGIVVALLLPLALLSGFLMALIVIGTVLGAPLFHPAVGAEGTDSFDAISRGFSYVYSRPWHFGWYQLVSHLYGVICVAFVWWFGFLMITLGLGAGRAGMAIVSSTRSFDQILPEPLTRLFFHSTDGYSGFSWINAYTGQVVSRTFWDLSGFQMIAGIIVLVWLFIVFGMLAGYAISYLCSSQTLIYFLLRKKVDGIEMNEVFEEKEEGEDGLAGDATPAPAGDAKPPEGGSPAAPAPGGGTPPAAS